MPGPPRKPTHLKLIEGNPGKRKINRREPKPTGTPVCPEDFTDEQRAIWNEALESAPAGLLTRLDSTLLATWCVACDLHTRARKQVNGTGLITRTPTGALIQNPYLAIINKQAQIMHKCAAEMGFTPASRSRIELDGDPGAGTGNRFDQFTR